jgi:NADH-quinone oxidoreductase subunit I
MNAITRYFKSLLLIELGQGLMVTGKYFFKPKFTARA